jgi:hypothetical protein
MKKLSLLCVLVIFIGCASRKTKNINDQVSAAFKCQPNWKYNKLADTLSGVILAHAKAGFFCGTMATASVSVILVRGMDTIRVLELCNISKDFKQGTKVVIAPAEKPSFYVSLPINSLYDCRDYKTYYGSINLK